MRRRGRAPFPCVTVQQEEASPSGCWPATVAACVVCFVSSLLYCFRGFSLGMQARHGSSESSSESRERERGSQSRERERQSEQRERERQSEQQFARACPLVRSPLLPVPASLPAQHGSAAQMPRLDTRDTTHVTRHTTHLPERQVALRSRLRDSSMSLPRILDYGHNNYGHSARQLRSQQGIRRARTGSFGDVVGEHHVHAI